MNFMSSGRSFCRSNGFKREFRMNGDRTLTANTSTSCVVLVRTRHATLNANRLTSTGLTSWHSSVHEFFGLHFTCQHPSMHYAVDDQLTSNPAAGC